MCWVRVIIRVRVRVFRKDQGSWSCSWSCFAITSSGMLGNRICWGNSLVHGGVCKGQVTPAHCQSSSLLQSGEQKRHTVRIEPIFFFSSTLCILIEMETANSYLIIAGKGGRSCATMETVPWGSLEFCNLPCCTALGLSCFSCWSLH